MTLSAGRLAEAFNSAFLLRWNTRLVGGFAEPLYVPGSGSNPAEIRFTRDYVRSALHELSHWCIAGEERRKLVDYGYWYAPDGRNQEEQEEFFKAELKPQALELAFSRQCSVAFEVSIDNLGGVAVDKSEFEGEVLEQLKRFETGGFPARAREILDLLERIKFGAEVGLDAVAKLGF